jgi:hypothetical protein
MGNFPNTVNLRFPLGRTVKVASKVVEFLDGSEQRYRNGPVLNAFSLAFANIPLADVSAIQSWFLSVKGAYDSTWSLAANGETFTGMCLESDELVVTETEPTRYGLSLSMRQKAPSSSFSTVSAFPGITGGRMVQRPWSGRDRFRTTRNDLDGGARISYYEWGTRRREWDLQYPCIAVSTLTGLMNHFVTMGGRLTEFSFTDPDSGTVYAHARYDTEEFKATYVDAGHCSVTLPMVAVLA